MSATAGMTVVAGSFHVIPPVDGTTGMKHAVGTCAWCGQTNISLHSHMVPGGPRYACLSAATQAPYIDPNQSPLPANQKGAAGYLHR